MLLACYVKVMWMSHCKINDKRKIIIYKREKAFKKGIKLEEKSKGIYAFKQTWKEKKFTMVKEFFFYI